MTPEMQERMARVAELTRSAIFSEDAPPRVREAVLEVSAGTGILQGLSGYRPDSDGRGASWRIFTLNDELLGYVEAETAVESGKTVVKSLQSWTRSASDVVKAETTDAGHLVVHIDGEEPITLPFFTQYPSSADEQPIKDLHQALRNVLAQKSKSHLTPGG